MRGHHLVLLWIQHKQCGGGVGDELLVSVHEQPTKLQLSLGVGRASARPQDGDLAHAAANEVFEDVGVADGAVDVREPDAAAWPRGVQNSILHLAEARDKASTKVSLTATRQM